MDISLRHKPDVTLTTSSSNRTSQKFCKMRRLKYWFNRETPCKDDGHTESSMEFRQEPSTSQNSNCAVCLGKDTVTLTATGGDVGLQLHDTIIRNDVQGCKQLLASGFDPNKPFYIYHKTVPQGASGLTTLRVETRFLHMAIIYRRPAVLSALLQAGADPNITDSTNRWPLQLAITYWPRVRYAAPVTPTGEPLSGDEEKFQRYLDDQHTRSQRTLALLLVSGAQADVTCGDNEDTLLHLAARYGVTDCLGSLLRHGSRLCAVNKLGETVLILALKKGNLKIAEDIICCGADVNSTDPAGRTALHYACLTGGGEKVVGYLKENGTQVDIQDADGNTPLHLAAREGHVAAIQALLEVDAAADVLNNFQQTPLFLLLDVPLGALPKCLLAAHRLLEASLCQRLTDYRGQLPTSLYQDEELCQKFSKRTRVGDSGPASLFKMTLHRTRRCLGYSNTCRIKKLQLDCPPGLKGLIAWEWQSRKPA